MGRITKVCRSLGALALVGAGAAVALAPAAKAQQAGSPQATFTKNVAPILQRSCQNCHRPGAIAPMSLLTATWPRIGLPSPPA